MVPLVINAELLRMSEEKFFRLCAYNRDLRIERDAKQNIIFMAPTGGESGYSESNLNHQVAKWNDHTHFGFVFSSSTGFTLSNGATRSPDVAWIKKERWVKLPRRDRKRFAHICPDFIIELLSESDSLKTAKDKMKEWIDNGCRLGWLIDQEYKTVYAYKPGKRVITIKGFDRKISGGGVLPGFELDLRELKII